jgi:large subunit ribosomal protein L10
MLSRTEKESIVAGLNKDLSNASAVFLTNLIGVSANDAANLRKDVRLANGKVFITRNTLITRAAKGTSAEEILKDLKGTNAVAMAFEDGAPGVAKALYDAGKELEPVLLKVGLLDGQTLDVSQIEALAKLPSRDQMLATLLATFNAPVSAFVRTMDAIKRQKEEGAAPAAEEAAPEATETTES